MARLICGRCQVPVRGHDVDCPRCGAPLYGVGGGLIVEPDSPPVAAPVAAQVAAPVVAQAAAPVAAQAAAPVAAPVALPRITVTFESGSVELPQQREIVLGRDASSPVSQLLQWYENVSRGHATVTVEPDGRIDLRDGGSVNGTWVDDRPVRPGLPVPLRDGVRLRLADVEAIVTVRTGG